VSWTFQYKIIDANPDDCVVCAAGGANEFLNGVGTTIRVSP